MTNRKLVVLGIPWDVDTEGLREYMSNFGELEDCIVLKERSTGRSRGFGYATFVTTEDAKAALASEHFLGNRVLEVNVATPKVEIQVRKLYCVNKAIPILPINIEDAAS